MKFTEGAGLLAGSLFSIKNTVSSGVGKFEPIIYTLKKTFPTDPKWKIQSYYKMLQKFKIYFDLGLKTFQTCVNM